MRFESEVELTKHLAQTCENERVREEFINWVNSVLDHVRTLESDRHKLGNTENQISGGRNAWKRFYEEFLPMRQLFGRSKDFLGGFSIRPFTGNQSYDAIIQWKGLPQTHLEIGTPKAGHLNCIFYRQLLWRMRLTCNLPSDYELCKWYKNSRLVNAQK